jgi:hypothetical protein
LTEKKEERMTFRTHKHSYLYYSNGGSFWYHNLSKNYAKDKGYKQGDEVGILLDMWNGEIKFTVNGEDMGLAIKDNALTDKELFFTVNMYEANQQIEVKAPLHSSRKGGVRDLLKIIDFFDVGEGPFSTIYADAITFFEGKIKGS